MSKGETYQKFPMIAEGIFNEGRMDLIDEILSPDYVEHATTFPGWPEGIEGLRQFVQEIRRAFPDLRSHFIRPSLPKSARSCSSVF